MEKVRYGIIGCGGIHTCHTDAIREMKDIAELVAVCDIDPANLEASVRRMNVKRYTDHRDLVSDPDVDAVTVCTPSGLHADHALAAVLAGKHVMSEKPFDVKLDKADAVIAAAKRQGVTVSCISQTRYGSGVLQLHRWLDSGKLGKLVYGEAAIKWYRAQSYYDSADWRGTWALDGGGALMNQGVHYTDQLRWAMGRPKSVVARMATLGHEMECEDVVTSTIEFESGAIGSLSATTCAYPGFELRLEVYGTEGSVRIVDGEIETAQFADGSQFTPETAALTGAGASDPADINAATHAQQLRDFTLAVIEGREPWITAEDGRNALELVLAVYESARSGREVRF